MKLPQKTLRKVASYLPGSDSPADADLPGGDEEYTIEELSQEANVTVRNIRAYQDKGILPYPKLKGRKGYYSSAHLSRLRTISSLLERGYTASSIRELYHALEQGVGIGDLIGVEEAVSSPWSDEAPELVSMAELMADFGESLTPEAIGKAIELELFVPTDKGMKVSSITTLKAGAELCKTGIPLEELLEILRMMRGNVELVANELVKLVGDHVLEPYQEQTLPPKEEFPRIAELVWKLRPMAEVAVKAEFARAMNKAANLLLVDKLEHIMSKMPHEPQEHEAEELEQTQTKEDNI